MICESQRAGLTSWLFGVLVTVGISGLLACNPAVDDTGRAELQPPLGKTRGYLLISIDTLRADHLGAYGYERETSPFLDSLAERSVVFQHALAHIPSTLPSHMSMFTGLYQKEHTVYPPDGVLPGHIETLPEIFKRNGYRTAGFTDGGYVSGSYGFSRGFDEFSSRAQAKDFQRRVEVTVGRGLEFLRSLEPEDDFFLFMHTYAVHDPYDPPEQYRNLFWEGEAPESVFEPTGPNIVRFNAGHEMLSPRERDYFVALYDSGIRYVDRVLEDFFAQVDALGLTDEITVIITSDHGEEFTEHGRLGHAQIFHHNLRVPLIIAHPSISQARQPTEIARIIDLVPTIGDLAGIEGSSPVSGTSLRPLLEGRATTRTVRSYAEASVGGAESVYESVSPEKLLQFVAESGGKDWRWVTPRGLRFDTSAAQLELQARAFMEARTLSIVVDGQLHREVTIESLLDSPAQTVRIDLPNGDGSKHRIELGSDSCAPASQKGPTTDRRCLSVAVAGPLFSNTQVYDVISDPLQQADLSLADPAISQHLAEKLEETRAGWKVVAEPEHHEVEPEVEERLRALGYL